jgi:hypothetical protein
LQKLVIRVQFKKLRLIHAIATKKKPSKQTGESGLTDPDAIDVAPIDGLAQIVPSTSQMSSPKSVRSQPSTPMELEDGQALKAAISHHCTQVIMGGASGTIPSIA